MTSRNEIRHLDFGSGVDERSALAGIVEIKITSVDSVACVISRVKEVLRIVVSMPDEELEHGDVSKLPSWLTGCFVPESDDAYSCWWAWWRSLTPLEREKPDWSLWRDGIDEENREKLIDWWCWWDNLDDKNKELVKQYGPWRASVWLYQFISDDEHERQWYWWDARVDSLHAASILIEVLGWPYPWDDLEWLLVVAGADTIDNQG